MTAGDRLSSTTLLALLPDRPSVPLSSLPEWTWGLTQQYKTNNTSAGPSVFLARRQLTSQLTVVHRSNRLGITLASSDRLLHRHESGEKRWARPSGVWETSSICQVQAAHPVCFWSYLTAVCLNAFMYLYITVVLQWRVSKRAASYCVNFVD